MRRSTRGRSIACAAPFAALVLLLIAAGCDARTASPSAQPQATASSPTGTGSPAASGRLPTPVPTPVPGSGGPLPTATAVAAEARLVIRLSSCGDTCEASAGTTVLDDGRVVWEASDGSGRVLEAQLSDVALARVRAAIQGEHALDTAGDFRAVLRPGGVAIPHGLSSLRFEVGSGASRVVVTSWDPDSLADQREQWRIPAQMDALGGFADQLRDPVGWLGAGAFATQPRPYASDRFLVVIDLFGDVGDTGSFPADADDVDWPFGNPIETAGEPVAGEESLATRCLILDGDGAAALRAAERTAGSRRPAGAWFSTAEYNWHRADGFLQLSLRQLLPHEQGTCRDLVEPSF